MDLGPVPSYDFIYMNKLIIVSAFTVLMAGCATSKTVDEFISKESTHKQLIDVPMNYQKVYRIVADQARKCLQQGSLGNENVTNEKLDTDIKMGVVTLTGHNAILGQNVMSHFVIEPGPKKDTTKLMVYAPTGLNQYADVENRIRYWLTGQTSCFVPAKNPPKAKGPG